MHPFMAMALTAIALTGTTAIHYEVMVALQRSFGRAELRIRLVLALAIVALVVAHLAEIGLYAGVYWVAEGPLQLGTLVSRAPVGGADLLYYAAETYSPLGYGDIIPMGTLRLIASVEPLNGLLLLSWSGAFLYASVHSSEG